MTKDDMTYLYVSAAHIDIIHLKLQQTNRAISSTGHFHSHKGIHTDAIHLMKCYHGNQNKIVNKASSKTQLVWLIPLPW